MSSFTELPPDIDGPPDIEDSSSPPDIEDEDDIVHIEASKPETTTNNTTASSSDTAGSTEEKTMMDQMMELQASEQKKKLAKRDAQRKKQDKTFGAGLKGGFFNQSTKSKKKKKKKKKGIQSGFLNASGDSNSSSNTKKQKKKKIPVAEKADDDDDVDFEIEDDIIRPKMKKSDGTKDFQSSLRFDEVQSAMQATMNNKSQWMTPAFMQRVASNPKLAMGMANPRCMQAMQDFQTDPTKAAEKYKDDEAVNMFMQEFMGMMGDHMHQLGEKEQHNQVINEKAQKEEAMKKIKKEDPEVAKALSNPEVFELLNDPQMKAILQECSTTPYALGKYMQDPKIRQKLMMMKKYGLIQF